MYYTPILKVKQEEIVNKEFFRKGLEIRERYWYNKKSIVNIGKRTPMEGIAMKTFLKPKNLPLLTVVLGFMGFGLRWLLYMVSVDVKNLLPMNHPLEIALWLVTAAALALIAAGVWKLDGSRRYGDNFKASPAAGMGHLAAAAGILLTALFSPESTQGALYGLWKGLGFLAAAALAVAGVCRAQGKRPQFLTHMTACVFLLIHLVGNYRHWSGNPQLQDYVFDLFGCVALMLFAYYEASFDVGAGKRRMQLAAGLAAVYLGCVALSGSQYPLLYLGGAVWAVTDLCTLNPVPRREKPGQKGETAP